MGFPTTAVASEYSSSLGHTTWWLHGYHDSYDGTGPTKGNAIVSEIGIFEFEGKRFVLAEKSVRENAAVTFYGRAYISVFGESGTPFTTWVEKDSANAPEKIGGFNRPTSAAADFVLHRSTGGVAQTYAVARVDNLLYVFYFSPIFYTPTGTTADPTGNLACCIFDMDTETWSAEIVSTNVQDRTLAASDPDLDNDVALSDYAHDGEGNEQRVGLIALYRRQDEKILIIGNLMTIPDPGQSTYWARPCYATFDIGTLLFDEGASTIDSWTQLGPAINDKDYRVLGAVMADDGKARLILGTETWTSDGMGGFTYSAGNYFYQTLTQGGVLSTPQDIGLVSPSFAEVTNATFIRPRCTCTEIQFGTVTYDGEANRGIKLSRASLVGDSPTWTHTVVITLPDVFGTSESVLKAVMSDDLNTLAYFVNKAESGIDPTPQALRVAVRSSGTWTEESAPSIPVPLLHQTGYIEASLSDEETSETIDDDNLQQRVWTLVTPLSCGVPDLPPFPGGSPVESGPAECVGQE